MTWHCEYCARDFQTENGLMQHFCKDREKLELLKSPVGQAAHAYYGTWMKLQKRSVPPADTFMNSRQFNHLVKFAEWVEKVSVPNPTQFIKLMVDSGTQPVLWCRDTTYSLYLDWYDNAYPPEQQFIESLDYIKSVTDGRENPFYMWTVWELAALVRRRRLSPWLLIASEKFLAWLRDPVNGDLETVSQAINFAAYIDKIKANPDIMTEFKAACKAEGL